MWPFKKKEGLTGLQALMDPTASFVGRLRELGGVGYVLLGSGLLLIIALMAIAKDLLAQLMPLAIALLAAGVAIVMLWHVLEYRASMLKLRMIVALTERMVDKKLAAVNDLDTVVMRAITGEILRDVWGLNPKVDTGGVSPERRNSP